MKNNDKQTQELVFKVLTEVTGLNIEDIHLDNSLKDDLHIGAALMTELVGKFATLGIELKPEDVSNLDTVSNLVDLVDLVKEV